MGALNLSKEKLFSYRGGDSRGDIFFCLHKDLPNLSKLSTTILKYSCLDFCICAFLVTSGSFFASWMVCFSCYLLFSVIEKKNRLTSILLSKDLGKYKSCVNQMERCWYIISWNLFKVCVKTENKIESMLAWRPVFWVFLITRTEAAPRGVV